VTLGAVKWVPRLHRSGLDIDTMMNFTVRDRTNPPLHLRTSQHRAQPVIALLLMTASAPAV
jgi:hypothetical protein